jgi:hypothetical protein
MVYKAATQQNKAESATRNRPFYYDPEWVLDHLTHRIEIRFKWPENYQITLATL